jgi:hypothetical protein
MCGLTPRHKRSRRRGEGKSRPDTPPTQRGSRSKVICCGRPDFCKKVITASNAVCSWKSSRAWADRAIEVPASTRIADFDHVLTLAAAELCSGETEPTSLRIHLDLFQWLSQFVGVRWLLGARHQTASSMQDLPNCSARAGQKHVCGLQRFRHEEGSRARPEVLAPASSSRAQQSASPQSSV